MKTAISVPEELYKEGERFAKRRGKSRSQLYSEALQEYLVRRSVDRTTEVMNKVCEELGDKEDDFVALAARRVLEQSDW